jgi:hypothetical protein
MIKPKIEFRSFEMILFSVLYDFASAKPPKTQNSR